MNKIWLLGASACMILAFGSCKPKQSAYRAAYEQAKEKETTAPVEVIEEEVVEVTPVSKPSTTSEVTRQEKIKPAKGEDGNLLKRYSVVIGSFKTPTNAYSLKERMEKEGYKVVLGENDEGMLRVIVSSFDDKGDAYESRDAIKAKYGPSNFQDAWILERRY